MVIGFGKITNHLDRGKVCIAVFLDLAKAFDSVAHDIINNNNNNNNQLYLPKNKIKLKKLIT